MSYEVTWLPGTKELLQTAFPSMRPADRREWFVRNVTDHVTQEIAAYPQDASAQPGQRVGGELHVAAFRIRYEIQMDTGVAIVTEVIPDEKRRAAQARRSHIS
jgi:hypothetical protein